MDTLLEILNVIGHSIYWIVVAAGGLAAVAVYLSVAIILLTGAMMGCENIVCAIIWAVLWPVWLPLVIFGKVCSNVLEDQIEKISKFMSRRKKVCVQRMFHGRTSYWSGTVKKLSETVFKDYLEAGEKLNSWVDCHPDTGEALVNSLNWCSKTLCPPDCDMIEPYFSLVPEVPKETDARRAMQPSTPSETT